MFTPSWAGRLLWFLVIPGCFMMSVPGCVSSSTYEAAKKENQDLQHELQQERIKQQAIEKTFGDRLKQMENLVSRLSGSAERYEGMAKSWSDLRDELTILRVNRELERQRGGGGIGLVLHGGEPSTAPVR